MRLPTPMRVQALQRKLCLKAKRASMVGPQAQSRHAWGTPLPCRLHLPDAGIDESAEAAGGEVNALRKNLIREPDALIAHVRFDEREWETEQWLGMRHRHQAKAAGQRLSPESNATAPVLDSTKLCGGRLNDCMTADEWFPAPERRHPWHSISGFGILMGAA